MCVSAQLAVTERWRGVGDAAAVAAVRVKHRHVGWEPQAPFRHAKQQELVQCAWLATHYQRHHQTAQLPDASI